MTEKAHPNIRELVLNALLMINEEGIHSGTVMGDALDKYARLDPRDRALFVKLIHGTLEYQIQLDAITDRYSKVRVIRMKPVVRNLLRMSLYQILYMDKIPDSAVCDEAVKLIRKTALRDLGGFVNGVLRSIVRDKDKLELKSPSEKYSVQDWMYGLLCESIGKEKTEQFLEYSLSVHGITVREAGTDNMRVIDNVGNIRELDGWKAGRIIVQDMSAATPVRLAGIREGDTVIDVCAAPGGKTIQAADKVGKNGRVIACDLTEKKILKIRENLERMHTEHVETFVQDAAELRDEFVGLADVVIADLPCSGIGTISKKPEIKNRLSRDDCMALAGLQQRILGNVSGYVRPGGKLVYSTCTLDHFENEDNVQLFLKTNPDFELILSQVLLPGEVPQDGFYVAVLRKNG